MTKYEHIRYGQTGVKVKPEEPTYEAGQFKGITATAPSLIGKRLNQEWDKYLDTSRNLWMKQNVNNPKVLFNPDYWRTRDRFTDSDWKYIYDRHPEYFNVAGPYAAFIPEKADKYKAKVFESRVANAMDQAGHTGAKAALVTGSLLGAGPLFQGAKAVYLFAAPAIDAWFAGEVAKDVINGNIGKGSVSDIAPALIAATPIGKASRFFKTPTKLLDRARKFFNRGKNTVEVTEAATQAAKGAKETVGSLGKLSGGTPETRKALQELADESGITLAKAKKAAEGTGEVAKLVFTWRTPLTMTKNVGKWTFTKALPTIGSLSVPYDIFGAGVAGFPEFYTELLPKGWDRYWSWRNRHNNTTNDNSDVMDLRNIPQVEPLSKDMYE